MLTSKSGDPDYNPFILGGMDSVMGKPLFPRLEHISLLIPEVPTYLRRHLCPRHLGVININIASCTVYFSLQHDQN
jgi:hypothetical protein